MIGSSCMMFSFGIMIHSISPTIANNLNSNSVLVPLNEDGSINVRLSDEQLIKLIPNDIQDVNIAKINGYNNRFSSSGLMKVKVID